MSNLYVPNDDSLCFFSTLFSDLAEKSEPKIIVGDFNLVMNPDMDRIRSRTTKDRSLAVLVNEIQVRNG